MKKYKYSKSGFGIDVVNRHITISVTVRKLQLQRRFCVTGKDEIAPCALYVIHGR